jgi:hypothetical protein
VNTDADEVAGGGGWQTDGAGGLSADASAQTLNVERTAIGCWTYGKKDKLSVGRHYLRRFRLVRMDC